MAARHCSLTLVPLCLLCFIGTAHNQAPEQTSVQSLAASNVGEGQLHDVSLAPISPEKGRQNVVSLKFQEWNTQEAPVDWRQEDEPRQLYTNINIPDTTMINVHSQVQAKDTTTMSKHPSENVDTSRWEVHFLLQKGGDRHAIKSEKNKQQELSRYQESKHQDINMKVIHQDDVNHQDIKTQDVNHQVINKQVVNHQVINKQVVNHQVINKQVVNHQVINKQVVNQQEIESSLIHDNLSRDVLDDSHKDITVSSSSVCQLMNNDTTVNCSYRNFTEVPSEGIPHNVTTFDLSNNFITKLSNFTFIGYTQLKQLDLSSNNISQLEELAFHGLDQLTTLNLWNNNLSMSDSTFPATIFTPLVRLEELRINKNQLNCSNTTGHKYPDKAFSSLTSLKSLYMDGLNNAEFGIGFQNLTNLVNLSMLGYLYGCCHLHSLRNNTFQYLATLQHLNVSSCYIQGNLIDSGAFSNLKTLISLDLTHNEDIDIQNIDNVFHGLSQIPTLKKLYMNLIVNRYSIGICLDSFYIRNIPPHLEHFEVQENNIEGLDRHVLGNLSVSLKTLDVSGNKFVFGTYLHDLHLMANLTKLKLNGGGFIYSLPQQYPFQLSGQKLASNCTLYGQGDDDSIDPFILKLPPNLREVEMERAGLTYNLSPLTVDPNNNLQNLTMKGNRFPQLIGPFQGLNKLIHLDLSSSYVRKISKNFFLHLTSLENLNLYSNLLGDFFSNEESPEVFLPLRNLKELDLSFNDIHTLQDNVFAGLGNLQKLMLCKNSLTQFQVNISHMLNLTHVNLTNNRIYNLPEPMQQHIDLLLERRLNVIFDLSRCPISCTCENLDFLIWMRQSRAFDQKFKNYNCVYHNNLQQPIKDGYNSTAEYLSRKCATHGPLLLCVAGFMFVVFCVIFSGILYRFRWKIRYLYYAAHLLYKSSKCNKQSTDYQYDAFISYDERDEKFVVGKLSRELEKRGLKLCIHGRDFRAGEYIASNIVRAVCESRKTVVVLTRYMVSSYWCGYEIQMANMEAVHTGRQVLIFLLMGHIPDGDLGTELLYHIKNNTYIPYPDTLPDATSMGRLWDKLASDIRDQALAINSRNKYSF